VNYNSSFNANSSPSATPNQHSPNEAPPNTLRDTLLQYISPEDLARAQTRAEAILTSESGQPSPSPSADSPRPSRKRSRRSSPSDSAASAKRHSRKCTICQHADRAEIEQSFMHWVPLMDIADEFDLPSADAVRRHALALGLEEVRNQTTRRSLYRIIERAGDAAPTAAGVIQAIRACSCLDDSGRWVEPPRRVIVTHEVRYVDAHATQPPAAPAIALPAPSATVAPPLPAATLEDSAEHHS